MRLTSILSYACARSELSARAQGTDGIVSSKDDLEFAAYEAVLIQDQNGKLSVFGTRPAILNFAYNFLVEFIGVCVCACVRVCMCGRL